MSLYLFLIFLQNFAVTFAGEQISTSGTYGYTMLSPYGINALSDNDIVFAVKACGHAHTALMSEPTDNIGTQYEVGIGGWDNQRSFIRSQPQGSNLAETFHSPLDCSSFKIFWISWDNGVISAGSGSVSGQNEFVTYNFGSLNPINYLACSTGWGASGEWLYNLEDPVISATVLVTADEEDQIILHCDSTGFPSPTITWKKSGVLLPGSDSDISVQADNSLKIDNAHQSDSGIYTCEASNILSTTTKDITLIVSPIDGGWSQWSIWSACSVSCSTGTKTRSRTCNSPSPSPSGSNCVGSGSDSDTCTEICDVDGSWTNWSAWSTCSVTCGGGDTQRVRTCTNPPPSGNGVPCVGNDTEVLLCSTNNCPVDGAWSSWGPFTSCNVTCGGGIQWKYRSCTSPVPAYGGSDCSGDSAESIECNTQNCTDPLDSIGCSCTCTDNIQNNTLEEKLDQLRNILKVNKSTLSSTKRKLISVGDPRPSAERIGYLGVVLLCMTGAMLVITDVKAVFMTFISKLYKCKQA